MEYLYQCMISFDSQNDIKNTTRKMKFSGIKKPRNKKC